MTWESLPRDEDGRWVDDGIPNKRRAPVASRNTKPSSTDAPDTGETTQAETVDVKGQDESGQADIGHTQTAEPQEAPVEEDSQKTAAAGYTENGATTGVPESSGLRNDVVENSKVSDATNEVENPATGDTYEQPKFRAVHDPSRAIWGISEFNWVGPEAISIRDDELDDFKAFVASL